tara:strand:+ start:41291 stop:42247 length:957 start_codon:yes stop_codon:yes gene_type:complete
MFFRQLAALCLSLAFSTQLFAIEIYAHRGGAGLVPENTLAAIASALSIGVDVIDVDIGLTQDNIVVAHHDLNLNPNLTRTLEKTWLKIPGPAIQQLTYEELGQYDVGQMNPNCKVCQQNFPLQCQLAEAKIPTLQQVIEQLKKSHQPTRLQIEIKTDPHQPHSASPQAIVMALIQVLHAENYTSQVEVHSFDWRNLLLLQQLAPEVTTSYLSDHDDLIKQPNYSAWLAGHDIVNLNMSYPKLIKKLGGSIWCPNYNELTPELLAEARELGLKVNVWTVDQPKDMQTMIAYGVDGIITNRPDLLRGLLAAQGKLVTKVA